MLSLVLIALVTVIVLTLLFGAAAILRGFAHVFAAIGAIAALGILWAVFGDPWTGLGVGVSAIGVAFVLAMIGASIYDRMQRRNLTNALILQRVEIEESHEERRRDASDMLARRATHVQVLINDGMSDQQARQFLDLINRGEMVSAAALYYEATGKEAPSDMVQSFTSG